MANAKKYTRKTRLISLGFNSYREYLASDLWKTIRHRVFVRDKFICLKCGKRAQHVHHLSYGMTVLAGSNDSRLVSLCQPCHHGLEFDGDRKRTRGEVTALGREFGLDSREQKAKDRKSAKKTKAIVAISKREERKRRHHEKWQETEGMRLVTERQVNRICQMSDALCIAVDRSLVSLMTKNEWNDAARDLQLQINKREMLRRQQRDANIDFIMSQPKGKLKQKMFLFS